MLLERIQNLNKLLANRPDWYGTQPLKDDTPENIVEMWEKALGTYVQPFTPTFRNVTGTDGVQTWPLNSDYFASKETAQEIAERFGDGTVTEVEFGGSGGLFAASDKEYHINANGRSVNAGLIASFYTRNPEDKFPGVADKLIRAALGLGESK